MTDTNDKITALTNNSTHEFTKHDLTISIDMRLEGISAQGEADITEAYHRLVQAILEHANDYDFLQSQIKKSHRQHVEIIGPF